MKNIFLLSILLSTAAWADSPLATKQITCSYAVTCSTCGRSDVSAEGSLAATDSSDTSKSFSTKLANGDTLTAFISYSPTTNYIAPQTVTGTVLAQVSVTTVAGKSDQAEGHLFYDPASYDKMFPTWHDGSRSSTEQLVYLWSALGYDVSCQISR